MFSAGSRQEESVWCKTKTEMLVVYACKVGFPNTRGSPAAKIKQGCGIFRPGRDFISHTSQKPSRTFPGYGRLFCLWSKAEDLSGGNLIQLKINIIYDLRVDCCCEQDLGQGGINYHTRQLETTRWDTLSPFALFKGYISISALLGKKSIHIQNMR